MNSHIWSWNLLELVLNMTIVIRGWSYSSISVLYILGYALWFFNNILNLAAAMPQYSLDFDSHNDWFGQNWDRNQSEELWVLLIFCGYHESSGFWTLFQLLPTVGSWSLTLAMAAAKPRYRSSSWVPWQRSSHLVGLLLHSTLLLLRYIIIVTLFTISILFISKFK